MFIHDFSAYQHNFLALVTNTVVSKLLYVIIAVISTKIFKPDKQISSAPEYLVALCVSPAAAVVASIAITYIGLEYRLDSTAELLFFSCISLLLISNIMGLMVYSHTQKLNSEYTALQISVQRDSADAEYYKMMKEQFDNQKAMMHDMSNHFNIIYALAECEKTEDIIKYIDELKASPELKTKKRLSDNPILNIILLRYSAMCEEKNIKITTDIRYAALDFIDASGITALFGNLLSNAIEAAASSEERIIDLSVAKNEDNTYIIISMINSCDHEPDKNAGGEFITRKADKSKHGYGLKSISRVVNKYRGSMKLYYDEELREFHSIIRIPVKH